MRRFSFLSKVLILLTFLFFCCGKGEKGVPPELRDKIVYVSEDGICTINPDGTDRKVIVPSERGGPFSNPKWSPDKRRIAFNGQIRGNARIMVIDSDGSDFGILGSPEFKKKLKPEQKDLMWESDDLFFCEWSPSGEYLLYTRPVTGGGIGIMTRGAETKIELNGVDPDFVSEHSIIFIELITKLSPRPTYTVSYDLKEKKKQILTDDKGVAFYSPISSPQGDKIAYGVDKAGLYNELWIMNSHGSGKKRLASQDTDFVGGRFKVMKFSPDGSNILFVPDKGHKSDLYIVRVDGKGLYAAVKGIVNADGGADWSSDGRNIIFTSNKDGNDELYIADINQTGLKRLTKNGVNDCCPHW